MMKSDYYDMQYNSFRILRVHVYMSNKFHGVNMHWRFFCKKCAKRTACINLSAILESNWRGSLGQVHHPLRSQFFCVLCQRENILDTPAELTLFWLLPKKHCFAHTLSLTIFQLKQNICINSLQNRRYFFRVFRFQASKGRRETPDTRKAASVARVWRYPLALASFPLLAWKTRKNKTCSTYQLVCFVFPKRVMS